MGKKEKKVEEPSSDLEEGVFEVETILDKRTQQGRTQYYIKWKGFNNDYNTWEDEDNVVGCPELVREYEDTIGRKKSKGTPGRKRKLDVGQSQEQPLDEKLLIKNANKTRKDYELFGIPFVDGIGFEYGDKLEEIVGCKPFGEQNLLFFYVKWFKQDKLTWVSNNIIKDKEPQLLIEFYENRLKFGYKGDEN